LPGDRPLIWGTFEHFGGVPRAGLVQLITGILSTPFLRLSFTQVGAVLRITAAGTPGSQWRLETSETMAGSEAWHPVTTITLGEEPLVVEESIDSPRRFYRGLEMP
jgi:hypothetical protein